MKARLFTRSHKYQFPIQKELLIYKLIGNRVHIHDLDFEVQENDDCLHITPHAEEITSITTLPETYLDLRGEGNKTQVTVTSKMRTLDKGGPLIVMIFCVFLLAASLILHFVGREAVLTYVLSGCSLFIFLVFYIRMQMGYFDYVRKVRQYVKQKGDQISTDVRKQIFKHKLT